MEPVPSSYEIVIVGAGPAGLSAALTARARNREVLMVSNKAEASPLAKAIQIDNYAGIPGASGADLLAMMTDQALAAGALLLNDRVIAIMPLEPRFLLTAGSRVIEAESVILAIGVQASKPLRGEQEYLGRGLSYCATCDGMLFRGRKVLVYGLNDESVSEANFLHEIGCEVAFISPRPVKGLHPEVEAHVGRVVSINGDGQKVEGASYRLRTTNEQQDIGCQAVFVLRPSIAPEALLGGLRLDDGFIHINKDMSTSVAGVFAAGDCTGKPHQIAKAVGEGQVAALAADEYLHHIKLV
ncbi:MAG: NAD(P)/FAD-dependent oxidoreductase [Coriobacteriia bacterium]|nr:NAD(P)/FAD-dependent oxidoreductase [Coriobacteriia bacterium]